MLGIDVMLHSNFLHRVTSSQTVLLTLHSSQWHYVTVLRYRSIPTVIVVKKQIRTKQ